MLKILLIICYLILIKKETRKIMIKELKCLNLKMKKRKIINKASDINLYKFCKKNLN